MKKKMIIIGSVFAVFLMLATPCISAVNAETVKEDIIETENYCPFVPNFIIGLIAFLAAIKGFADAGVFNDIIDSITAWLDEIFQPSI